MVTDPRLGVEIVAWKPKVDARSHNSTFIDKPRLLQSLPAKDAVLFLDADTTVHGDLSPLFEMIDATGFALTQWNDWVSTGKTISGRIRTLLGIPGIPQELIHMLLAKEWPSPNTGVFGAHSDSKLLAVWEEWTAMAARTFIPDEKAAHLLLPKYLETGYMDIAKGGRWNCSPKFKPEILNDCDVRIWHYHGDSNYRASKSPRGYSMWQMMFSECLSLNLGGVRDWMGDIPNKHLQEQLRHAEPKY
jgi:hypothetical protein